MVNLKKVLIGLILVLLAVVITGFGLVIKNEICFKYAKDINYEKVAVLKKVETIEENANMLEKTIENETIEQIEQPIIEEQETSSEEIILQDETKTKNSNVPTSTKTSNSNKIKPTQQDTDKKDKSENQAQKKQNETKNETSKLQEENNKNKDTKPTTQETDTKETQKIKQEETTTETNTTIVPDTPIITQDEEKYIRNDEMINKIKTVIENNPSEYMKTYGYEVVIDISIKERTNQFTFTELRVKAYITHRFGTIKIYAEDYYRNGKLIMTECYIY